MKYRFKGPYKEFMGRVFAFGNAVDVQDGATLRALEKHPEFELVKGGDPDGEVKEGQGARKEQVLRPTLTLRGARK